MQFYKTYPLTSLIPEVQDWKAIGCCFGFNERLIVVSAPSRELQSNRSDWMRYSFKLRNIFETRTPAALEFTTIHCLKANVYVRAADVNSGTLMYSYAMIDPSPSWLMCWYKGSHFTLAIDSMICTNRGHLTVIPVLKVILGAKCRGGLEVTIATVPSLCWGTARVRARYRQRTSDRLIIFATLYNVRTLRESVERHVPHPFEKS